MIPQDLLDLFNDLKKELVAVRTDLIVIKYSIEQMEKQLEELSAQEDEPADPFADRRFTKI